MHALLAELKRRHVFRALIAWGVFSFAVLQIIEPIMHGLRWPEAVLSYVVAALAAGFPVAVGLAWMLSGEEATAQTPRGLRLGPGG